MGDSITAADMALYDSITWHQALDCDLINKFPNLCAFVKSMQAEPKIKAYLSGSTYFKAIFPPFAQFQAEN